MSAYTATTDVLRPFQIERSRLRGRFVRLDSTINSVLKAHDYPLVISQLLGELLLFAGGLAGGLKFDGRFSLQIRGEGPVRLMVADTTNDGQMRGYASFDKAALAEVGYGSLDKLVPKGILALTVDQTASGGETYQGIVELDGSTLQECMLGYFHRSEQIQTGIRASVDYDHETSSWRAGAIIVQSMPGDNERDDRDEDGWRRAMVLLQSATDQELVDPSQSVDTILLRLFHEDGVRIFEPIDLIFKCSCDEDRVALMLRSFSADEIEDMKQEDGRITVTCEFCSRTYLLDEPGLRRILQETLH